IEGDLGERRHGAEALGDAARLEDRSRHGGVASPRKISSRVWKPSLTTVPSRFSLSTAIVGDRIARTSILPLFTDERATTTSRLASLTTAAAALPASSLMGLYIVIFCEPAAIRWSAASSAS